jgi:hypothetical protein
MSKKPTVDRNSKDMHDDSDKCSHSCESTRHDTPEALVRQETRVIRALRKFAVLILFSAALIMAGTIFAFIRQSQRDNLKAEFVAISESITNGLLEDSARYVHFGETVVAAIEMAMAITGQDHKNLSIPSLHYNKLVRGPIVGTRSRYFTWNPLLRSDEERFSFESMVTEKEQEGFVEGGDAPSCYVCGSEDAKPGKPDAQVHTTEGTYTCDNIDNAARLGLIPLEQCPGLTGLYEVCGCDSSVPNDLEPASGEPKQQRKLSDGIFRYADSSNSTIINEPWHGGPYLPMWQDRFAFEEREPLLYNHLSHPKLSRTVSKMIFAEDWQISEFLDDTDGTFFSNYGEQVVGPISLWYFPVQDPSTSDVVGAVSIFVNWNTFASRRAPRNGDLVDQVHC